LPEPLGPCTRGPPLRTVRVRPFRISRPGHAGPQPFDAQFPRAHGTTTDTSSPLDDRARSPGDGVSGERARRPGAQFNEGRSVLGALDLALVGPHLGRRPAEKSLRGCSASPHGEELVTDPHQRHAEAGDVESPRLARRRSWRHTGPEPLRAARRFPSRAQGTVAPPPRSASAWPTPSTGRRGSHLLAMLSKKPATIRRSAISGPRPGTRGSTAASSSTGDRRAVAALHVVLLDVEIGHRVGVPPPRRADQIVVGLHGIGLERRPRTRISPLLHRVGPVGHRPP